MQKLYSNIMILCCCFLFLNSNAQNCIIFSGGGEDKTQECNTVPMFDAPTAYDDCCANPAVSITYQDVELNIGGCLVSIKRIWTATSTCDNTAEYSQTITFIDDEAPEFIIDHPLFTIYDSGDTLTAECEDGFFVAPDDVTANDNCDDNPTVTMYDDILNSNCPTSGFSKLLYCYWVAEDVCNNKDTFEIYVKFVDNHPPEIYCPEDITLSCIDSIDPSETGMPTATDNCNDPEEILFYYSDETEVISDCEWLIKRTWVAEDACGNTDMCIQKITLIDDVAPKIDCPEEITIDCDVEADPSYTGFAGAYDECSDILEIVYQDDTTVISNCEYVITRLWIAHDLCSNADSCTQIINVIDLTAPEITCPEDLSLECGDSIDPAATGYAVATDNCTPVLEIEIVYTDDSIQINECELIIARTWTATDYCGNVDECLQNIKITDTTPPEIVCPADVTLECTESSDPSNTGYPEGYDICDPEVEFFYDDTVESDDCTTTITRKWTVGDDCGNVDICEQTITITDTTAPEITCPADIQVECFDSIDPSYTGNPETADNCDTDLDISYTDTSISADDCTEIISRYWEVIDNCGNASSCTQTITITDTTAPEIYCPGDVNIECTDSTDPSDTGMATASDTCDDDVEVSYSDDTQIIDDCSTQITRTWTATNNCGLTTECTQVILISDYTIPEITCPDDVLIECNTSIEPSATGEASATDNCDSDPDITYLDATTQINECETVIIRTWAATDNCGIVATCNQEIKITDTTSPEITCPADIVIECTDAPDPSLTGEPTATDNCDVDLELFYDDTVESDDCTTTITRKWTVGDNCGNVDICEQTITITDTTAPEINCAPDMVVECNTPSGPDITGEPFAYDNCDAQLEISYEDSSSDIDDCASQISRVWAAEDDCGNVGYCTQLITINDSTAPSITCPEDIQVECNAADDPSVAGEASGSDNCDVDLEIAYDDVVIEDDGCSKTSERTWTLTDDCGNSSSCIQTIIAKDTTNPEISCPADIEIECDESTDPSNTGYAEGTDNCDLDLEVYYHDDTTYTDNCTVVIERGWTVTDDCGNTAYCTQTITVSDTQGPSMTCPADIIIECNTDSSPTTTGMAEATDNCDDDVFAFWTDESDQPDACQTIITRTFQGFDDCGNVGTCTQTITITDTTVPSITCSPDITVECNSSIEPDVTGEPFAADNCDAELGVSFEDEMNVLDECVIVVTRTWTAYDDCENSASCIQLIQYEDSIAPEIYCPEDIQVDCNADYDPSIAGEATGTDNCDDDLEITYEDQVIEDDGCSKTIERTWTATDDCGNSVSCTQTIIAKDTTNPEISCPEEITIECDQSSDPSVTGYAEATDNCDVDIEIYYMDDTTYTDNCTVVVSRAWSAMDDCGNISSCNQTINISDTQGPTMTCPDDISVECNTDTSPTTTGMAEATDNCDDDVFAFWTDVSDVVDECQTIIERTFQGFDDCGNVGSCTQIIMIIDSTTPTITCAPDVLIECDEPTDPSYTGEAYASDNCDSDVSISYEDSVDSPDDCVTFITRSWTAMDNCGNESTCLQIIQVEDTVAPNISCPSDIEVSCDSPIDTSITGEPTVEDNCDMDIEVSYSDEVANVEGCQITYERTWLSLDDCANVNSCVQSIIVNDYGAPEITCPEDVYLSCEDSTDPADTGMATATDNCDENPEVNYSDEVIVVDNCKTEIYRTWTASDDCGNSISCTQLITVEDTTAPEIYCPEDQTISCYDSTDPADTGSATASDNCDDDVEISYEDEVVSEDNCTTVIERTWTATDDCGLSSSCVQTITVTDNEAPQITCPMDVVLNCTDLSDPSVTGEATASDNCTDDLTITYEDNPTQLSDCTLQIIRTWSTADDCGNEATCSQYITVTDNTEPELTCPENVTIDCQASTDPSETGTATVYDICDDDVEASYSDVITEYDCETVIERTWSATDECGNTASCVQIITITDTTEPTNNCPQPVTVECDAGTDPAMTGEPFAFDDCDPTLDITYSDEENVVDDCLTELTRTWTATDDCGNASSCEQVISITDTTAPEITCPEDITIECTMDADPANTGYAEGYDNCDQQLEITYADDTTQLMSCHYIITRVWTAVDDCGNSIDCTQTITIVDETDPLVNFAHPLLNGYSDCDTLTLECGLIPDFSASDASSWDACDEDPEITFEESTEPGDCYSGDYVETRTLRWIATDDCDNADTIKIIIQVVDTTPPVITPDHPMINGAQDGDTLVIDCESFWFLGEEDVIAEDECTNTTVVFEEEVIQNDCYGNGLKVVLNCSWIATDECGNSSTLTLVMEIIDQTAPVLSGVPADTSVFCVDIPPLPDVTAIDGCDGAVEVMVSETEEVYSSDDCKIIRTWTATDECGNTVTQTQEITIYDCVGCFVPNNPNFIFFDATTQSDETVYLEWEFTAVAHQHVFLVQRSADNQHFEDLAIVPGVVSLVGDSDLYEFIDSNPRRGNNYYRIKSVNAGPSSIISESKYIRFNEEDGLQMLVYPNPTTNYINVEIVGELDKEVEVQIVNELGQVVQIENLAAGSVLRTIDLSDLKNGVYFVTLKGFRNRFITHKIVKMK